MSKFAYTTDCPRVNSKDGKAVDQANSKAIKASGKIGPLLHVALVACAEHAAINNDASKMTNLYNSLGDAINKKRGIMFWVQAYTSLEYRKDKAGAYKFLGKEKKYAFIEEGISTPFYTMERVKKAAEPFDLVASFNSLMERAENKKDKLSVEGKKLLTALSKVKVPDVAIKVAATGKPMAAAV